MIGRLEGLAMNAWAALAVYDRLGFREARACWCRARR